MYIVHPRLSPIKFTGGKGGVGSDMAMMWKLVNEDTGASSRHNAHAPSTLSADTINLHYASVSADPAYTAPIVKSTCSPSQYEAWPTTWAIYDTLTHSKTNATGTDNVPPWFTRHAAPFIAAPLAHLFHHSLTQSVIPSQWKCAIIVPVPKVPSPLFPADYRPISVLPLFSTVLEKLVIRHHIYPNFHPPPLSLKLSGQFVFH